MNEKINKVAFVANTSWFLYNFRLGVMRNIQERGGQIYCIAPIDSFSKKLREEGFIFVPIEKFILLDEHEKDMMGKNGRKKIIGGFSEDFVISFYINILATKF